tara:strand:+ start:223 stop:864 length:642 start_codon:yes stop_codon:yes gene_type:complete
MALKLLNPGLRPLGQFDLDDTDAGLIVGGEHVALASARADVEGYAADVGLMADFDVSPPVVPTFQRDQRTGQAVGGLADEGGAEYGTQFGSLIGQNAGRSTQFGIQAGAVVVGPTTDQASGKVTVWAQSGLYGVTDNAGAAAGGLAATDTNDLLTAAAGTGLLQDAGGGAVAAGTVAIYVSEVNDTSLVSTTATAVGAAAQTEYHAIFHLSVG